MQTIRVINVLWMRYSTLVGEGKTLTTLNSSHNLFDQAQRAPKQMYDKQH
jgi:hypothetical protein